MTVRQLKDGQWLVELRPEHSAIKQRKREKFASKKEAVAHERHLLNLADKGLMPDSKTDNRKLSDMVELWFDLHGHTLKDGQRRKNNLLHTCSMMGDPLARKFDVDFWMTYRKKRMDDDQNSITKNTLNHQLNYLKGVFTEAIRAGKWKKDHPLKNVKPLVFEETELTYLTTEQIAVLLPVLRRHENPFVYIMAVVCLQTGCRWGEVLTLTPRQLKDNGRLLLTKTKSNKPRSIPISAGLMAELQHYCKLKGPDTRIFSNTYTTRAFAACLDQAGIELPKGQKTHVLRHTFASHYIMNGGNILTLNKILGHLTLQVTLRYAHLAPEHFSDVITKGPMAGLSF